MRVRALVSTLLLLVLCAGCRASGQEDSRQPTLLLSPKLLRRLQRDRQRQTARWLDFEKRVQTAPDSPERGFELALYYAIARDEARGRDAVAWALHHKTHTRQVALVLDWAGELANPAEERDLQAALQHSDAPQGSPAALRDALFRAVLAGNTDQQQFEQSNRQIIADLKSATSLDGPSLYAASEYLMTYRSATHNDVRDADPTFFNLLPREFLLSLRPQQVEQPPAMAHLAALALVTLDPNLENSQYLQGWAMEDRQTLHDGAGVAYELLWADPYLPGIAYQNMDPWTYDRSGVLFARANWDADACWLHISARDVQSENCAPATAGHPQHFGTLTLQAVGRDCAEVPTPQGLRSTLILWKIKPGAQLGYESGGKRLLQAADPAGMWPVPNGVSGRICLAPAPRR